MIDWKKRYRNESFDSASLAATANELLETLSIQPEDKRIGELTARTFRYYIGQGLLTPSERLSRGEAVYNYLNLLQVMAIRRLQAVGLSLKMIGELKRKGDLDKEWDSSSELEKVLETYARIQHSSRPRRTRPAKEINEVISLTQRHKERPDSPRRLTATEVIPGVIVLIDEQIHSDPAALHEMIRGAIEQYA